MSQNASNSLTASQDKELVKLVKESGDDAAFNEICRRYENIFYKICQRYVGALSASGVNTQDIFDEKNFIIYHCVSTFKPRKKAKLSTWIGNYARYLCLNSINKRRFILPSSDDEVKEYIENQQASHDYFSSDNLSQEDMDYVTSMLNELKDDRIIQLFRLRYFSEPKITWAKIAKKMNISIQTAMNLHNKGLALLKNKLKSEHTSLIE